MTKNIGTPYYQAPELLIEDNYIYTNKVDIWALGMMWYELLTGRTMIESMIIIIFRFQPHISLESNQGNNRLRN